MSFKVIILNEAKADIVEVRVYYSKILRSLSKRFTEDVKSTVGEIANNPFTFGFRFDTFRTANLSIFPYQVHYLVSEKDKRVIIFGVLHASRDPQFIKTRLA